MDCRVTEARGAGLAGTVAGAACLGAGALSAGGLAPVTPEDLESACFRCSFKVP